MSVPGAGATRLLLLLLVAAAAPAGRGVVAAGPEPLCGSEYLFALHRGQGRRRSWSWVFRSVKVGTRLCRAGREGEDENRSSEAAVLSMHEAWEKARG